MKNGQGPAGLFFAILILMNWVSLLLGLLLHARHQALPFWTYALALPLMTFCFTGLFILSHDALHGSLVPGWPRLNRAVGQLTFFLYAGLPFGKMAAAHVRHHEAPTTHEDPDFHFPGSPRLIRWYLKFMWTYASPYTFLFYFGAFAFCRILGVSTLDFLLLWALPALLSSFQLFYFGTYRPHRAPASFLNRERAVDHGWSFWPSLLTCYHFGHHRRHHQSPELPWWTLATVSSHFPEKGQ